MQKTPNKPISISAFFPAYNDDATIQSMVLEMDYILKSITGDYEIIVVNDASQDATKEILDELAKTLPAFRVIHHKKNMGYGGALQTGFNAASKEWVFYTDGDGQYDIKELKLLLPYTDKADIITGYKIARSDSLFRIIVGRLYHWLNKVIFGIKVRDVDCDFRLIRKGLLKDISFDTTTGFFPVEMVRRFQDKGARFYEVPVHHYYRKAKGSQFFSAKNILKVADAMKSFWKEVYGRKKA